MIRVLGIIQRDYVDEKVIEQEKLIDGAIKGMLEALDDPHSIYLPDKYMKDMNTTSNGFAASPRTFAASACESP